MYTRKISIKFKADVIALKFYEILGWAWAVGQETICSILG